jgi:hypothetical protein
MIASGVSSTIRSTPVAASMARILRPFAADDLPFDLVCFKVEYGNGIFDGNFGSSTLDGLDHDLTGLFIGFSFASSIISC